MPNIEWGSRIISKAIRHSINAGDGSHNNTRNCHRDVSHPPTQRRYYWSCRSADVRESPRNVHGWRPQHRTHTEMQQVSVHLGIPFQLERCIQQAIECYSYRRDVTVLCGEYACSLDFVNTTAISDGVVYRVASHYPQRRTHVTLLNICSFTAKRDRKRVECQWEAGSSHKITKILCVLLEIISLLSWISYNFFLFRGYKNCQCSTMMISEQRWRHFDSDRNSSVEFWRFTIETSIRSISYEQCSWEFRIQWQSVETLQQRRTLYASVHYGERDVQLRSSKQIMFIRRPTRPCNDGQLG